MPPDEQIADWLYVADAAEVFRLAYTVQNPAHRIFNMAGPSRKTGEITAYMREILPGAQISVSDKPFVMTSLFNTTRLRTELGFTPKYTVEEGILAYLNDVRNVRACRWNRNNVVQRSGHGLWSQFSNAYSE